VQKNGVSLCCGGILGMGENREDRIKMIETLATREQAPDSIPINLLSPVPGTPFENQAPLPIWEILRVIATVRILFPKSQIRLAAGRKGRTLEEQTLCFLAGVNSIFIGEMMLTQAVPNPSFDQDAQMFSLLGLQASCIKP
jgi:biotin synthase